MRLFSELKLHYLLPILGLMVLTSCLSTKTFKTYVRAELPLASESIVSSTITLRDYTLTFSDSIHKTDSVIEARKKKSYFIPAIVFWGWNNTIDCSINKKIYLNDFVKIFEEKAVEFNLKKHLGERKLVIDIEKVPSFLSYTNSGAVMFAVIAYSYVYGENISPAGQSFRVRYKIMQGDVELENDLFEVNFSEYATNNTTTTEKFVQRFVENNRKNYKKACGDFFNRVIENL